MATARLCLEFRRNPRTGGQVYRVTKVEQSVTYTPGQYLTKKEVADLCEQTGVWRVVIEQEKKR